jgi:hypothetical protein
MTAGAARSSRRCSLPSPATAVCCHSAVAAAGTAPGCCRCCCCPWAGAEGGQCCRWRCLVVKGPGGCCQRPGRSAQGRSRLLLTRPGWSHGCCLGYHPAGHTTNHSTLVDVRRKRYSNVHVWCRKDKGSNAVFGLHHQPPQCHAADSRFNKALTLPNLAVTCTPCQNTMQLTPCSQCTPTV